MKKYSVIFFIKQSLNGLFRNGIMSLTSTFILMSCLILMGCFGLLIYNININLAQLSNLNKIIVYISDDYKSQPEKIDEIKELIKELPNTDYINYISSKDALDMTLNQINDDNSDFTLFDDTELYNKIVSADPMPNTIEVEYKDINDVNTLIYQIRSIEGVRNVKDMAHTSEAIINIKNVIMLVLVWFLVVLFIIAIFIILNTVKLSVHSRKDEIVIMRYIGATNFFILFPFLLEGVIIGVIAGSVAYILQWYIYGAASSVLLKMETTLKVVDFSNVGGILFTVFITVGVFCGLLGSSISSHRYLKA